MSDYVPHDVAWPGGNRVQVVGYPLPLHMSPRLWFSEKTWDHGRRIEVLVTYRPLGEFGPKFRAARTYGTGAWRSMTNEEFYEARNEARRDAWSDVIIEVDRHNACVEAWPT